MLLRDKFWLWGHPEGKYNYKEGNMRMSRMTPMEGCLYLGVRNTFMVPCGTVVNRRQYNKSFKTLKQVGWECFRAATDPDVVDPLINDAKEFDNIGCVVFDDFVGQLSRVDDENESLKNIMEASRRVHNNDVRSLDVWMVLYTLEFGLDPEEDKKYEKYFEPFDGIIMWTWKEKDVPLIPEKFEIFKKLTPNKRRMCGCYLYNFGEYKQATGEAVKWQLDWYREKLLAGEIEGVVLHTNTMADLDYEAYDVACAWMEEHGDEIIPD